MTYYDVAVKVLAEITGEPLQQIREILKLAIESAGVSSALTDELSDDDASRILDRLRSDPSKVLSLYAAGKGELRRY